MRRTCLALAAAALLAVPAAAAERAPLTAEAMWQLKRIGTPALSPDGRSAVVPVTAYDTATDGRDVDLWLVPTAGGEARQLTSDPAAESEPQWSPDGRWIAFVARRDGDKAAQLYVLPVAGGEARRVTEVPTGVRLPRWLPDSRRIAFLTRVWTDLDDWQQQGKRLAERDSSKMSAKVWDRPPLMFWDHWLDDREAHVYIAALDGGAPVAVTRPTGKAVAFRDPGPVPYDISPDGTEIAFAVDVDPTGTRPNVDLFVAGIDGSAPRNLTADNRDGSDGSPLYSPDGRWLAFQQQRVYGFYGANAKLMLYDRRAGKTRGLTENWDRSASGIVWAPDSKALYGAIDDAATRRIYRFMADGGAPQPVTGGSDFAELGMAGKPAVLVALRQSFSEPPTLVRVDPRSGDATTLTGFNDDLLGRTAMGTVESVSYKGAGGDDIQMWVIKPPGFDPTKTYPVFLLLHGGPHNAVTDTWQWRWNAQVFAGWGYVVAWHNFHGSSGFGEAFTDSINPDRIDKPYQDTIKAADWLAAQPWADRTRMVAGGGSYGGFLATVLLGREHPFKALIAHAAVYNSYTQEGGDGGGSLDRFGEHWDDPAEFQRYSPHMAAGNFRTPTLVIHGQLDYRVPVNQGIELFHTLQRRGVPSRFIYYPNENHWVLKPQNSVFWYQQVQDWVRNYAPPAGGSAGPGTQPAR
ncbi:prolyl oligopeptidase family serine peptidase [Rhodocista pekingensis]|uniref:Acyl-peptide hydrolase n=1 Tax=Rhodocista pekingensis TaxID=201185 RepID=A0ABW2KTU5_9PROT